MCTRKIWNEDDFFDDLFDSVSFNILWWPGIEDHKVLSDISMWIITGHSIRWHEKQLENAMITSC
jgi:hypothetical protein